MDDTAGGISTLRTFCITHSLFTKPRFLPKQPLIATGRAHTFAARPGKAAAETRGAIPAEQLRDIAGDGTPGGDGGDRTPGGETDTGEGRERTTDPGEGGGEGHVVANPHARPKPRGHGGTVRPERGGRGGSLMTSQCHMQMRHTSL